MILNENVVIQNEVKEVVVDENIMKVQIGRVVLKMKLVTKSGGTVMK